MACGRKAPPLAPELVRPGVPDDVAAISTPAGVQLTWLRPTRYSGGAQMNDLAGFTIERAPAESEENVAFAPVGTVELTDQTRFRKERHMEWTDKTVTSGERYLYRVVSTTMDGAHSEPSTPVAIRFGAPTGPTPSGEPAPKEPQE